MKLIGTILLMALVITCSCNKDNTARGVAPVITHYSPTFVINGSQVVVYGEKFGSNAADVVVRVGSTLLPVNTLNLESVIFDIPANFVSSGNQVFDLQVIVSGQGSNVLQMPVYYERQGWYYVAQEISIINATIPTGGYFSNDKNGIFYGPNLSDFTDDSGKTWNGFGSFFCLGSAGALSVYNNNTFWMEASYYDIYYYESSGPGNFAQLDTINSIPLLKNKSITGLYNSGPRSGYLLSQEGVVLKLNGSFAPSSISVEYQPVNYTNLGNNPFNRRYTGLSVADPQNFAYTGRPIINSAEAPVIVHKRNGIYTEYNLTAQLGSARVNQVQCVDASTAYFSTSNYELYKFTGSGWTKLTTPPAAVFRFINANVGYLSPPFTSPFTGNYIYKTTDGGQTWAPDFQLTPSFYALGIITKGDKVWVYGRSTFDKLFLVKYNP